MLEAKNTHIYQSFIMLGGTVASGETLILTTAANNKKDFADSDPPPPPPLRSPICYEGERLFQLLNSLHRKIDSARTLDGALPLKVWLKQQFSIGVNDVTRVLERMAPAGCSPPHYPLHPIRPNAAPPLRLQVILLASDCCPRSLTRHLPSLASSRNVPLIFAKDKKGGSLKLGELVKLKTSIAIGVKAKRNAINQLMEEIISGNEVYGGVET